MVLVAWQMCRTGVKSCVKTGTCEGGPVLELVEVAEGQERPCRASNERTSLACTAQHAYMSAQKPSGVREMLVKV